VHRAKENINKELQEIFLVVKSNAVVDPRAMMIHASDTATTSRAMMTTRRL
jgi:hypothetical protein